MAQDFWDELDEVKSQVAAAIATEQTALGEFIRHEVDARADSPLPGIILAAAFPAQDSPNSRMARLHLATAMVLLDVALALHKLLLLQDPNADTLDKSLVGGTVLAGDYCFSQAAVAAARTGNPQVVAIFSELLKELSEAHLRHHFDEKQSALNEFPLLFHSGGLAGAVLAGQTAGEQQHTADFAASLAAPGPHSTLDARVQNHQHTRWLALMERGTTQPPHPSPPQIGEGTGSTPPPIWGRLGGGE